VSCWQVRARTIAVSSPHEILTARPEWRLVRQ
jgi:hypothetical protein